MQPLSSSFSRSKDAYNTNGPSASRVSIIRNYSHMCEHAAYPNHAAVYTLVCVLHQSVTTVQGWHLFCSELLIVWLLFEGGRYSKKYGSRRI